MTASADALAGPPELGRSVLIGPGDPVPDAWIGCERLQVSAGGFSAEIGRRLRDAWLTRTRLVIELDGDLPDVSPVWRAPWWKLTPGLTLRSEVLTHLLTANAVDARDPERACFAPVEAALRLGATRLHRPTSARSGGAGNVDSADPAAGDIVTDAGPVWCDGGPLDAFGSDRADCAASELGDSGFDGVGTDGVAPDGAVPARTGADGGDLSLPVIPAANLAAGSLSAACRVAPLADLAPDQQAAVGHLGGAACIVAPAGSGKTRVLTERARYLVRDVGVAASAVCLVAFNVRARREMQERTADLPGIEVRTLNSLALAICNGSGPFARPARHGRIDVIDEMGVRGRLDGLVKRRRRAMTDQLAPWLEALSASRLGLRDPADVEFDFQPDVPDFATLAPQFVEEMSADGLVDFDQQIIRAIEILLADPAARAAARRACGVLLVDEFQDLTPAHLLMIRLLAGPRADVFAVGDDDQTIYGYAGASPQWLIDFDRYFPGAARHHLNVNYRCPPPVIDAAINLLSHNRRRIDKQITAPGRSGVGSGADGSESPARETSATTASGTDDDGRFAKRRDESGAGSATTTQDSESDGRRSAVGDRRQGAIVVKAGPEAAAALREAVTALIGEGAQPSDIAVLARVNSTLLVPQIVLGDMGVAADAPLGRGFMERTGVAGALAWLRLAVAPRHALPGGALSAAARRPPRGISPRAIEWIGEQRSLGALRALAGRLSDERTSVKIDELADDLDMLRQRTANEQLTAQRILEAVRDDLGLGNSLDTRLDASRRSVDRSAHGDDLRALISVAHLHPDPASFPAWLEQRLAGTGTADTAGFGSDQSRAASSDRSWTAKQRPDVSIAIGGANREGADAPSAAARRQGVRLATVHKVKGLEWPHVIIYEASEGLMPHRLAHDVEEERRVFHVALTRCSESVTLVCDDPVTPFLAELSERAPPVPDVLDASAFDISSDDKPTRGPTGGAASRRAGSLDAGGAGAAAESTLLTGTDAPARTRRAKPQPPTDPDGAALFEALRAWRLERSRADGVPAYVVSADAVLIALATQRPRTDVELLAVPGIGPAKLESYGAEVLAIIAEHQ